MPRSTPPPVSRRTFVNSLAAATGVAILGFDPRSRSWIGAAHAQEGSAPRNLPAFEGELVEDAAAIESYSQDFGHLVRRVPRAVLKPRSVDDVVKLVRFANDNGIEVAMRGQGHAQHGQGLVDGGVVIDSGALDAVVLAGESISAGGGALWGKVADVALAAGLTPPVMVDFMGLTVGGVLAGSGGFGFQSTRYGLHTDHVSELDVVTGTGERVRCSKTERADLFDAMLVGQGQCGLIVGATLRLIRAPSSVRTFTLAYPDLAACTADAVRLVREDRFDALGVNIANAAGGGFAYSLAAGVYVRPGAQPDEAKLLAGLNHTASSANEAAYPALVRRLDGAIGMLRAAPGWTAPHPWLALMLPASKIGAFVAPLLANPAERAGVIPFQPLGLLPLATARLTNPLLCAPAEDVAFSVVLLRTAQPATADGMLALNRTLYERARDLGGKRVIWGAIPFSAADWADHYGEEVGARFRVAKRRYDPRNVLTPGPGIF